MKLPACKLSECRLLRFQLYGANQRLLESRLRKQSEKTKVDVLDVLAGR